MSLTKSVGLEGWITLYFFNKFPFLKISFRIEFWEEKNLKLKTFSRGLSHFPTNVGNHQQFVILSTIRRKLLKICRKLLIFQRDCPLGLFKNKLEKLSCTAETSSLVCVLSYPMSDHIKLNRIFILNTFDFVSWIWDQKV